MTGRDGGEPPVSGQSVYTEAALARELLLRHAPLITRLRDVALDPGERQFLVFRASVLAALSARPELRRLGVLLHSDDGYRLVPVDGVARVRDLWAWLVSNVPALVRDEPQAAALIIPHATDGTIRSLPAVESSTAFDLSVCMVDDSRRVENAGFRCLSERGQLTRLPSRAGRAGPTAAVASLLGTLLAEQRDPPPSPVRFLRPARNQPAPAFEPIARAA
jgi:hypothetical protein